MATNLEKYKKELAELIQRGDELKLAFSFDVHAKTIERQLKEAKLDPVEVKANLPNFKASYQAWYSEASAVLKQLLPDRLADFIRHYEKPKSRKAISYDTYRIEDALQGLQVTRGGEVIVSAEAAIPHIQQQIAIVRAMERRFESSLFDIRQLVQADLLDGELDAARELLKSGFTRAAGAIAGVVLEKHLGQVVRNHSLSGRKAHPTINDFNEALKTAGVIDIPSWRFIQRLGDIRNLCDHGKQRDPTSEEVDELIAGTDKISKTVY